MQLRIAAAALTLIAAAPSRPSIAQDPPPNIAPPPHGFFTALPKLYGRLEKLDPAAQEIRLTLERDGQSIVRPLRTDVDVFSLAGLGGPDDLRPGERIWVVFDTAADRKELKAARFIADEIGIQSIHGDWYAVESIDAAGKSVVLSLPGASGPSLQTLVLAEEVRVHKNARRGGAELLAAGDRVRYQTRFEQGQYRVSAIYDAPALVRQQAAQAERVASRLRREGVPGEVAAAAAAGPGDLEILLYRPGGDAARNLGAGDRLRVRIGEVTRETVVARVQPWGEKTRLRLTGAELKTAPRVGDPVRAFVPRASSGSGLPPGLGRAGGRTERIEWLLSSIYCTCPNRPDVCTGHLYTLSMCNSGGCGMPDAVRAQLGEWIDAGKTDAEMLALLEKQQGELLRRMHLVR